MEETSSADQTLQATTEVDRLSELLMESDPPSFARCRYEGESLLYIRTSRLFLLLPHLFSQLSQQSQTLLRLIAIPSLLVPLPRILFDCLYSRCQCDSFISTIGCRRFEHFYLHFHSLVSRQLLEAVPSSDRRRAL